MATRLRLTRVGWIGFSLPIVCPAGAPSVRVTAGHMDWGHHVIRSCSVHDLLPLPCESDKSSEWSDSYVVELPYNCTCAALKGRRENTA